MHQNEARHLIVKTLADEARGIASDAFKRFGLDASLLRKLLRALIRAERLSLKLHFLNASQEAPRLTEGQFREDYLRIFRDEFFGGGEAGASG